VVEGNGTLSSTQVTVPATATPVLNLAGLGVLQASCSPMGGTEIQFLNNSGTSITVSVWGVVGGGIPDATFATRAVANGGAVTQTVPAADPGMGITWMASFGQGSGLHLATINTSTAGCAVSAQATYTS
jgi:hypothetical protein